MRCCRSLSIVMVCVVSTLVTACTTTGVPADADPAPWKRPETMESSAPVVQGVEGAGGGEGGASAGETKKLYLDLVKEMLAKGLPHAALAYLAAMENQEGKLPPEGAYLRAEALRKLSRLDEAQVIYHALLDTSFVAQGHHGLGLIAAAKGDRAAEISHFERAVRLRPTDSRMRNDLGFALMLQGKPKEAEFHLRTALELGGDKRRSERNLIILHYLVGDESMAERLAVQAGIKADEKAFLRDQAMRIARGLPIVPGGTGADAAAVPGIAPTPRLDQTQGGADTSIPAERGRSGNGGF